MTVPPDASQSVQERRVIGPWTGTAIVAGSMIGAGIFLVPRVVAEQVHSPALFLLLWAIGGAVALAGAVAYAELGAMLPQAGGDYVFLREAFGSSVAFAAGWVLFLGVFGGSIATMSAAISTFQVPVLLQPLGGPDLSQPLIELSWAALTVTGTDLVAIGLILVLTLVNIWGVRPSAGTQLVTTAVPVLLFAVFAAIALVSGPFETAETAAEGGLASSSPLASVTAALVAIYFAYAGWNAVAYVGGEVAEPGRNIPRSLIAGTLLITLLYLLLCGAFLTVLGLGGLTRSVEAGTASAVVLLGDGARVAVASLIAVALLGSLNGTVLGGARIAYAMANDRALPRALSRLNPRTRVPARALWAQGAISAGLVLTGTFDQLLALTSIAMLLLGGLTVLSLFVLRRRWPEATRPYRATGFPWLPGAYLLVSALIIAVSIREAVTASIRAEDGVSIRALFPVLGLGLFLLVLAAHAIGSRLRRP